MIFIDLVLYKLLLILMVIFSIKHRKRLFKKRKFGLGFYLKPAFINEVNEGNLEVSIAVQYAIYFPPRQDIS